MPKKVTLLLLSLFFLGFLSMPVFAADQTSPAPQPNTTATGTSGTPAASAENSSGPFSSLAKNDAGIQPITPIDLNALGNKAVNAGNTSYDFLLKESIPLFIWAIGGSVIIILLGIFFGKRVIVKGIAGVLIALIVVVMIHYLPQIVLTVKTATGSAIAP